MAKLKQLLFGLLMLMLGLPLLQRTVPIFDINPLKGSFQEPVKPGATLKSVFSGSYQEDYNDYYEHTIGFRPLLVRMNNQLDFWLFDTARAAGVVVGRDNYLFEINYIRAWKGWDFSGYAAIEAQARKAALVHENLQAVGKTLVFVLAPGKASFFPDKIPAKYLDRPSGEATNYAVIREAFARQNLPVIDFNAWFMKMKDTATYPLYPQCGIHWSAYGVALAVDSLISYIESRRGIDMVDFRWDGFDLPDTLRSPDYDVAEGMNLLFTIPHYPMAYPRLRFGSEEGKVKPNAIVVSDSYYWNIYGSGISSRLFADDNFWYYNEQVHNPQWREPRKTAGLNLIDELGRADVIIIMATEANLYRFPYGFIDQVYDALNEGRVPAPSQPPAAGLPGKEEAIAGIMQTIDSDPGYRASIREKAAAKGITYEEMLRLDAGWIWEQKQKSSGNK